MKNALKKNQISACHSEQQYNIGKLPNAQEEVLHIFKKNQFEKFVL